MIYTLGDRRLETASDEFWVAPNASVIGSVRFGENVSIWFNAVLRGDNDLIDIGANTNIQDGSVLHVDPGCPLKIGEGVTIGHKVMLHGCTIGDNCLIGINSVVLNRAKIGENSIIGANTLVPEGMEIPPFSLVLGSPAKIKKTLTDKHAEVLRMSAAHYVENSRRYHRELKADERY